MGGHALGGRGNLTGADEYADQYADADADDYDDAHSDSARAGCGTRPEGTVLHVYDIHRHCVYKSGS
jgi:hypothetical protein